MIITSNLQTMKFSSERLDFKYHAHGKISNKWQSNYSKLCLHTIIF